MPSACFTREPCSLPSSSPRGSLIICQGSLLSKRRQKAWLSPQRAPVWSPRLDASMGIALQRSVPRGGMPMLTSDDSLPEVRRIGRGSLRCTLYFQLSTLYALLSTLHFLLSTLCSLLSTLYSTLHSPQSTRYSLLSILSTLSTLYPLLSTLYSLCSTLYSLVPSLYSLLSSH